MVSYLLFNIYYAMYICMFISFFSCCFFYPCTVHAIGPLNSIKFLMVNFSQTNDYAVIFEVIWHQICNILHDLVNVGV